MRRPPKIFQAGSNKAESSATFPVESHSLNLGRRSEFLSAAATSAGVYSLPLKMQDSACVRAIQRQARLPYLSEWRGEGQKRWHFTHTNYSPNKKGNYDEENNICAYVNNIINNDGAVSPGANDLSAGVRR